MSFKLSRNYDTSKLPFKENLSKFKVPYTPEKFSPKEKAWLKPFFTNIDKPVFAIKNLPEEVIGALSSRYSRSTFSLRRMFINEYVSQIVYPEKQVTWEAMSKRQKKEAEKLSKKFDEYIKFLNKTGGVDEVVNVQRGRAFFDKWLAEYGDDSIAELGGIHLSIEGLSRIAANEIEAKRIGISPLEKSTRYVSFVAKRADGEYQYIVPGEIKGSKYEKEYKAGMDNLFALYAKLSDSYLEYIKNNYPMGSDETERSFANSRSAKRFDDLRDILPFSTQTNMALFGNGRAFEDLINRLLAHPLGEMRWWGQQICIELQKVVPSFVVRPVTERGAATQYYRRNLNAVRQKLVNDLSENKNYSGKRTKWVDLVSYDKDAELKILVSFLFPASGSSMKEIENKVKNLSAKKRAFMLSEILKERKFGKQTAERQEVRFRKVPRAFENSHYLFEASARGGDFHDLHRHRQQTQDKQKFTTHWGYDLESDVLKSPFAEEVKLLLEKTNSLFNKINKFSPYSAQYSVPSAFIQHWYMNLTAREIYWIGELRTGPQGRNHYRMISQQIVQLAKKVDPVIFSGLMADMNEYTLARRESEKKIEAKINNLNK
jgi:thymidylate synthase ThyX